MLDGHLHVPTTAGMKPDLAAMLAPVADAHVAEPNALADWLLGQGIELAWLISYDAKEVMGYGTEAIDRVLEFAAARPEFVPIGGVHPKRCQPGTVRQWHARGLRGWKLHPVHQHADVTDARLHSVYEELAELGMPIIVHTGPSVFPDADNQRARPRTLAPVLKAHPDLQVIIGHGGRPKYTQEALDLLRFDNAWLDWSGCPPKRLVDYFGDLDELAPRSLWGSDWPGPSVPSPGQNAEAVAAQLSPKSVQILDDNLRLLQSRVSSSS